jgi:hypothetical protein
VKRLAFVLALALAPSVATAKGRAPVAKLAKKPAPHPAAKKAPASGEAKTHATATTAAASDEAGGDDTAVTTVQAPAASAAPPATKVKTKSYSFGAMDVEGKLKTPQLLYFLNRVKLELDMSAPDKRSFMKELQQSADDKSL